MSYKNPISREDPQALEKLQAKKEECEKLQTKMKSVNAYYKKNGTCVGHPELTDEQARKLEASMSHHSWDNQPYPSYALTNNNAEIRRLKKRIEEISHDKEIGFVDWQFEAVKRLQTMSFAACSLSLMKSLPRSRSICSSSTALSGLPTIALGRDS